MERILGIDPGLRRTGFGVIERRPGGRLAYVASGTIRVADGALAHRLAALHAQVREVVDAYAPQSAAVEQVFVNVNPHTTLLLGQARGAALCALAGAGLPVSEYTALQVKQAVVGYGRATKAQVQAMVVHLLALPAAPAADAADALACAACHAHGDGLASRLRDIPALAAAAPRGLRLRGGRWVAA
jgi:crossover junction endodeoxyribonuclease RuvC